MVRQENKQSMCYGRGIKKEHDLQMSTTKVLLNLANGFWGHMIISGNIESTKEVARDQLLIEK